MRLIGFALLLLALTGCGSSSNTTFTLQVAPGAVTVQNGGSSQALTVAVEPAGGFNQPVTVSLSGMPAGVTATPTTATVTPGQLSQFLLSASGATVGSGTVLSLKGTAGQVTASATASLAVTQAASNANLSTTSFDFGGDLVGSALTRSVVTVTNTGGTEITLSPTMSGDSSYSIATAQSCGASLAAGASCAETVVYAPTTASGATPQTATLNLGLGNVPAGTAQTVALTGVSAVLAAGTVTATNNPLVAQYSMTLPFPGSMTVNFGADTTYGKQTWTQSTTANNQTVSILVAGMPQSSTYHLQAGVQLVNGVTAVDADHTFTNGTSEVQSHITAATTAGMTPQSGVEELTVVAPSNGLTTLGVIVTDLQGNTVWSYALPNEPGPDTIDGAKLMPNGHFLITTGQGSAFPLTGTTPPNAVNVVREIDLAGNIVREISVNDLTNELQAAGYQITLQQFHHDVTPLPNGHWLVLSNSLRSFTNLPGYPGVTNVLGDVVIDLDQGLRPVWVWDEFDHLDVNRHPMMFPDWTHTNAVVYSPSDHNLFVSMRHQNWVVKVDYQDGAGSGNILWHLGQGGDFTLVNGTDPTDWQYAQHFPSLFSSNSSGVFSLGLMDNGDDREFPAGVACNTSGAPACLYTTIPVYRIDEGAKTATLLFHQILGPSLYSFFGGNTELMGNGNVEYDLAGPASGGSDVFEVTQTGSPQTIWHLHVADQLAYRGYRLPSLYPGVQW